MLFDRDHLNCIMLLYSEPDGTKQAFPVARDKHQTMKEVTDFLKFSDATVRRWIKKGDLRAISIGREWRIADRDLEAFLCFPAACAPEVASEAGQPGLVAAAGHEGDT